MTKIAGSGSGSESGSISQRHGSADPDPDPDPPQNVMDPRHWFKVFLNFSIACWCKDPDSQKNNGSGRPKKLNQDSEHCKPSSAFRSLYVPTIPNSNLCYVRYWKNYKFSNAELTIDLFTIVSGEWRYRYGGFLSFHTKRKIRMRNGTSERLVYNTRRIRARYDRSDRHT